MNDHTIVAALKAEHPDAPLISFSHFVPRPDLNPEKRFLFFPPLAKVSVVDKIAHNEPSLLNV